MPDRSQRVSRFLDRLQHLLVEIDASQVDGVVFLDNWRKYIACLGNGFRIPSVNRVASAVRPDLFHGVGLLPVKPLAKQPGQPFARVPAEGRLRLWGQLFIGISARFTMCNLGKGADFDREHCKFPEISPIPETRAFGAVRSTCVTLFPVQCDFRIKSAIQSLPYAAREETHREHLGTLRRIYGYRMFAGKCAHRMKVWLVQWVFM